MTPLRTAVSLALLLPLGVHAHTAQAFAPATNGDDELVALRLDVDARAAELAAARTAQTETLAALRAEKLELEQQLRAARAHNRLLVALADEESKRREAAAADDDRWRAPADAALAAVRAHVERSLPFASEARLETLGRIDAELHAAEPDRARAMQRLWRFVEEEAALGDEVALGRQALQLGDGAPELCEVLRIGMAVAYARSPGGALAWAVREGERWSWQPLPDATATATVGALFDAFAEHRGFGPATLLLPAVEASP